MRVHFERKLPVKTPQFRVRYKWSLRCTKFVRQTTRSSSSVGPKAFKRRMEDRAMARRQAICGMSLGAFMAKQIRAQLNNKSFITRILDVRTDAQRRQEEANALKAWAKEVRDTPKVHRYHVWVIPWAPTYRTGAPTYRTQKDNALINTAIAPSMHFPANGAHAFQPECPFVGKLGLFD